jgi:Cu(I)/Ag(I) efflux system membrane fusion protein
MTRWERIKLIIKVAQVRLRFIAVLVVTGLVIGYWDTLENYRERWFRTPPRSAVAHDAEFFCPMHPSVVRYELEPGGKVPSCPICGMPLAQRRKGTGSGVGRGAGRVQLSPERIELGGIRTEPIGFHVLEQVIETSGSVQYDEGGLSKIVARVNGYLEKLYVDKSFVPVKEGDPLAEIYSPELYTAVRELLLSRSDPGSPIAAASRERLRLLGVDEKELERIQETGSSDYRIVIRSPQTGHVIQREVVRGSYVTVGTSLFEVADLSSVWIEADIYEKDVPFLREGALVEAWVEAVPNQVFTGKIALVHPHVEAMTRTNTVRFTVDNPGHLLRPGMFATVRIKTPLAELAPWRNADPDSGIVSSAGVLAVPERALIDTGSRKVAYVEHEAGIFDAVRVQVGPRVGELYPVLSGLRAGDRVATAGAFLIDAETRLDPAAASTFVGAGGGPRGAASPDAMPPGTDRVDPEGWRELSPEDRQLALEQRTCPVSNDLLGGMGTPVKVVVNGKAFFICCESCRPKLEAREKDPGGIGGAGSPPGYGGR